MNKKELAIIVAQKAGVSPLSSKRAIEAVLDTIQTALKNGDKVRLLGFGTFKVSRTKARDSRNPKTGAAVRVKAKNKPVFVPGKPLKEATN